MPPGEDISKDSGDERYTGDKQAEDTAPDTGPETPEGEPAAFPTVTPGDEIAPAPERPPSPLTPTDDGSGVILDPEAGGPFITAPIPELVTVIAARGADGREYVADYRPSSSGATGSTGGEVRWAVSVIETKVPYDQRPTRGILDTPEQQADRRYEAVWRPLSEGDQLGAPDAPDDDPVHGVGSTSWWRAHLTEAEVATLRAAPHVESVTYEHKIGPVDSEWAASFTGSDFNGPAWRAREARRAGGEQQ